MLSMTMFYYTFSNAYSGTSLYEDYIYALFNVTFCGLPVIAIGALDRDLSIETVKKNPLLYREGRLGICAGVFFLVWVVVFGHLVGHICAYWALFVA